MDVYREWTSKRPWKERKRAAKARVSVASQLASRTQDPVLLFYGRDSGVVGLRRSELYQNLNGSDVSSCGYDKVTCSIPSFFFFFLAPLRTWHCFVFYNFAF